MELIEKLKEGIPTTEIQFNWDQLLRPYRKAGSKDHRIDRTWDLIIRWLIDKHKFEVDIVGAAIFMTALELKAGMEFKGNTEYGSKGSQLDYYIRQKCIKVREKRLEAVLFEMLGRKAFSDVEPALARKMKRKLLPWYKRIAPQWLYTPA